MRSAATNASGRVVVLSTADYSNPVWTNKQYIASGLAETEPVIYMNSLGLRAPSFAKKDLLRAVTKLKGFVGRSEVVPVTADQPKPSRLSIKTPLVLPYHEFRIVRFVNRLLMASIARQINLNSQDLLWSYSPLTYGWERIAGATVYHSVDLLHTIPGIPSATLIRAETDLIRSTDRVIASSHVIASHLRDLGAEEVLLWENVAATDRYTMASQPATSRQDAVIFSGHMTSTKVNIACMQAVLESGIPLTIAGQIAQDGTTLPAEFMDVLNHSNVTYLGVLNQEQLAAEVGKYKVGIIPYVLNAHTSGIFPMKVYEYLAAGLSVISTDLLSLRDIDLKGLERHGSHEFGDACRAAITEFDPKQVSIREGLAAGHSWAARVADARILAQSFLGRS